MIYQHDKADPVFEFRAPLVAEKLAAQLGLIGISDTKTTLPLKEILSNISVSKGATFFTKYFGKATNPTGKILEALFTHNLLRPRQLDEEFGSEKFDQVLHNVKDKNWKLTAFDSTYGPKSTEFMFKHCIIVQHGVFPQAFPTTTPGHYLYPERPEKHNGFPTIMLQKNIHTGNKLLDSLDIMYLLNNETHILREMFRYQS